MTSATEQALFLDTSIQIARLVHGPLTKRAIEHRLAHHPRTVTSLVVRQEFKRRLLKEAECLLRQLRRFGSFGEVHQHVTRLFGAWHERKRNICLQTLVQVHGGNDEEQTERLQLYLRSLLVDGLRQFDQMVDNVRKDSKCACALYEVVEKVELQRYELGPEKCSRTRPGTCGIVAFINERRADWEAILNRLRSLPNEKKSKELRNTEQFLERCLMSTDQLNLTDPCLKVGDLLIALESAGISHFFTLNSVESQHLCRALGQSLIVRRVDPLKPEVLCSADDPEWPDFGPKDNSKND